VVAIGMNGRLACAQRDLEVPGGLYIAIVCVARDMGFDSRLFHPSCCKSIPKIKQLPNMESSEKSHKRRSPRAIQ
jgi:hypothetical protein